MIEKDAPSVQVRIRLFGECYVEYREKDGTWKTVMPQEWGGTTHSRRLLGFLLLHGRSAGRGKLMEQLWPGSDSASLEGSLNKAVSNVRKVFRAEWLLTINSKRTTYQLADQSRVWADVDAYEAALQEAEQCAPDSLERSRLLEMAQAYFERGPLLDGEGDVWCYSKRELFGTAYYEMALVAAREAENPLLEAIALARMSRIFKYCAQKEAILPALQYARRLLKNQSDSPTYSWLCAEEALAYARSKREYESFKTLEQVTQVFQPNDLDSDPYWVGFEANVKAGFFGSCYTALQQFEQAEVSYREALAQISPASRINSKHRRSLLSVNLATILLRQEAVEEACKLAQDALVLINQSKSPLVLQHLVKFKRKLEPWKTLTAVETFNVDFMQAQTSLLKR